MAKIELGDLFQMFIRHLKLDAYGTVVGEIDAIKGSRSYYYNWGAVSTGQAIFSLATATASMVGGNIAANNNIFPNATRVRIVAIALYAAASTTFDFYDGIDATTLANDTQKFPRQFQGSQGNVYISKTQLGDGGFYVTSGLIIKPSANNAEAWVAVVPEYINPE